MRKILISIIASFTVGLIIYLTSNQHTTHKATYFRVWQGFKKDQLSQGQFLKELPAFMKETVDLYKEKALNNYIVVIPPANKPEYIPDELALVALSSEEDYREIRATKHGKEYSTRHWDIFNKSKSSSSKHFIDYTKEKPKALNNNWVYDMTARPIDWSKGYSVIHIGTRKNHLPKNEFLERVNEYAITAKQNLEPLGMNAYIFLVNDNYEIAYINWESKKSHDIAFKSTEAKKVIKDANSIFDQLMYQEFNPFVAGSKINMKKAYSTVYKNKVIRKKALIVVTSHDNLGDTGKKTGFYLPEVAHPFYALQEMGIHVDIASIKGGKAPIDENSIDLNDPVNKKFLEDNSALLEKTLNLEELNGLDYNAIIFAGGHGTMWDFPHNKMINELSKTIYENGGVVSAVCHGPAALLGIKLSNGKLLVDGQNLTAFTNEEEKAANLEKIMPFLLETELSQSAKFIAAPVWSEHVVVDGRLVTGQNPASAHKLGIEVGKILEKI
ncbi:MAG: type 1 glutamine amidotransferase domain-containing protein [Bdellovibrionota bacterium]